MRILLLIAIISSVFIRITVAKEMDLQECIAFAQTSSDAAKVAEKQFLANIWDFKAFKSSYLPQFNLSGSAPGMERTISPVVQDDGSEVFRSRNRMYSNLNLRVSQRLALTGTQFYVGSNISRIDQYGDYANNYWSATPIQIGITQPLFKVNTYKWDNIIEDMSYENMKKSYAESMEDIAIEVTSKFFDLYIAEMNIKNALTNKLNNDTLYMLSEGRYKVGKIAENDLLQSELAKLQSEVTLESANLNYDRILEEFKIYIGLKSEETISIIPETTFEAFDVDADVAMKQALRNRSDMTNYKISEERAKKNLEVAKSNNSFTADISASFGMNQTAGGIKDVYHDLLDQERIDVSFSVPLFQWGKSDAEIASALANKERVEINNRQNKKLFETQVKFQTLTFKQLQKQVIIAAKSDTIAQKRFDVAYKRFMIGKIDMNDLFLAQKEKDQAFQTYISTLKNYWVSYYRLRRTTLFDFKTNSLIEYKLSAFKK